ncbi:hypothetical protein J7W19_11950 [Streptomyces mobaraensis NBRC 13819 = DSM 40847]|uniref:Excreted virulence factor EspC, type VII ESX diderm n=1 Tax=Streptomyces mobaraensis (strain ATCC 29032 / DSM 40847 / JCM 4168 / NBRC 13819 / NCIMB 11159 / IPCR 16-22) TaxID=1223523 RepID=M3C1T1_STRM1|nr:hypothetical protein [Streptomyces mobaraensis]EME97945.1 hypothetical protein H340_23943 [Streptomyces mobaraensis NBRC 13819 = DSM 40847]QTT74030.1 hypothetical protein J7W19_11950 [Streptomyces mobaraensis NBRC 13819 = DSM 40847]
MSDFGHADDGMADLLRRLNEVTERMHEACAALKKVGPKGLGTQGLDAACYHFQDNWHDGIKRIAKGSKHVHSALKEASKEFTEYEHVVRQGFSPKGR